MRQTVNILNDLDDFIDEAAHGLNDVEMERREELFLHCLWGISSVYI